MYKLHVEYYMLYDILSTFRKKAYYDSAVCVIFDKTHALEFSHVGPASPDALYDMASVSKIITTTLLLQLMDEGRLHVTDLCLPLLPFLAGPATLRRLGSVTVGQLMTHTSGILPWYPLYADGRPFPVIFEMLMETTPEENGYAYSDLNYMLLGMIYTNLTGMSLREGVENTIAGQFGIPIGYGPVKPAQCAPCCLGNQIEKRMCA